MNKLKKRKTCLEKYFSIGIPQITETHLQSRTAYGMPDQIFSNYEAIGANDFQAGAAELKIPLF